MSASLFIMENPIQEEKKEEIKKEEEREATKESPKIKHIVCSGGGVVGFAFYGFLQEANKQGLWDIATIQTMYGTSIGSLFNVILSLGYSWEDMDDYLIQRPWETVYKINMYSLLEIFTKKGIFDRSAILESLSPLLKGKDLSVDITMQELFAFNSIEHHIFTTDVNRFEIVDVSYKTHPDWKVVDAVYCSCCLPVLFPAHIKGEQCFYDGAILMDFPLEPCIQNGADPDEILSIARIAESNTYLLNEESSLIDHLSMLVYHYVDKFAKKDKEKDKDVKGKYQFTMNHPPVSIENIIAVTSNSKERIRLIEYGKQCLLENKTI